MQLPGESQSENREAPPKFTGWTFLAFDPADPEAALGQLPSAPAVFVLHGADSRAEPYIGRTPHLRGRLERLLQPSARHPRRLHLAGLVRRIEWRLTGSDFESLLLQFELLQSVFGAKAPNRVPNQAIDRMHLRHPAFVRFLGGNPYPRLVVTHRPSQREADWAYGPFPSRTAAERYAEEVLKLFLLRRCTFDLNPDPGFPGCVYSEMKMCLAPCYKGCSDERYAGEAAAVESFLAARGESRLVTLRTQRDAASANLEFESAAALHAQVERVENLRALASELVRPMSRLRAVILQASANPGEVAVFLFENGTLRGPAAFSTLGMLEMQGTREQGNEGRRMQGLGTRDVGTGERGSEGASHPSEQLPLAGGPGREQGSARILRTVLESRLEVVLAELSAPSAAPSAITRQGHFALLKRWYYRPEVRRSGEIFFPDAEERLPIRAILRGISRLAAEKVKSSVSVT